MEQKIKKSHIDYGFGFPVKLINVPMVKVRGEWTPNINYNKLTEAILKALCFIESPLTGNEVHFIRQHFEMTLQKFAKRFYVTHPAVIKWEKTQDAPTGMNWQTEKDIRLFVLLGTSSNPRELVELYRLLEEIKKEEVEPIKIDSLKLAA